jgi:hypothetical protein
MSLPEGVKLLREESQRLRTFLWLVLRMFLC